MRRISETVPAEGLCRLFAIGERTRRRLLGQQDELGRFVQLLDSQRCDLSQGVVSRRDDLLAGAVRSVARVLEPVPNDLHPAEPRRKTNKINTIMDPYTIDCFFFIRILLEILIIDIVMIIISSFKLQFKCE